MRRAADEVNHSGPLRLRRLKCDRGVGVEAKNGLVEKRKVSAASVLDADRVAGAERVIQFYRLPLRLPDAERLDGALHRNRRCNRRLRRLRSAGIGRRQYRERAGSDDCNTVCQAFHGFMLVLASLSAGKGHEPNRFG